MGEGGRPRARTMWMGAIGVGIVVLLSVGFLLIPEMQPPTITCSTAGAAECANTRNWISDHWGQDWVFSEPLPARLAAVDVRETPPEWKQLPSYRDGNWAALLTLAGREPVLVACWYSSDDMVACDDP